jgi:hypothetical protein
MRELASAWRPDYDPPLAARGRLTLPKRCDSLGSTKP